MRDEGRGADVYAWSWPARLSGEDPYEWRGPVERAPLIEADSPQAPAAIAPVNQPILAPLVAQAPEPATDDVWVELPEKAEAPVKPKRSRSRGRAAKVAEPMAVAASVEVEEAPETAPTPTVPAVAEEPAPEAPVAEAPIAETPVRAPVLVAEREAPAPIVPDPAEVVAPPAQPRRGWWRRGA